MRKIIFPRNCWDAECPNFHAWDMSIDDYTCYCDKLQLQVDACDEWMFGRVCPLYKEEENEVPKG